MHGPGGIGTGGGSIGVNQQISNTVQAAGAQMAGGQQAAGKAEDTATENQVAAESTEGAGIQDAVTLTQDPNAAPTDGAAGADAAASTDASAQSSDTSGTQQTGDGAQTNYGSAGGGGSDQTAAQDSSNQFLKLGQMVRTNQTAMAGGAAGASKATAKATEEKTEAKAAAAKDADKKDAATAADAKAKSNELFAAARTADQLSQSDDVTQNGQVHHGGHGHTGAGKAAKEEIKEAVTEEEAVLNMANDGTVAEDLKGVGIKTGADKEAERAADDAERTALDREAELAASNVPAAQALTGQAVIPGDNKGDKGTIDAATAADVGTPAPDYSGTREVLRHAHPDGPDAIRNSLPPDVRDAATTMFEGQNPKAKDGQVSKGLQQMHPIEGTRDLILTIIAGVPPVSNGVDGDPTGVMLHTLARQQEPIPMQQPVGAEV